MSPATRRRPTGRATTRRRPRTPKPTRSRKVLTELGELLGQAKTEVTSRTTKSRCPHCPGMPWVNQRNWASHQQMHRQAGPKGKGRNQERMDHVRARGEKEWWGRRPRSTQANPAGWEAEELIVTPSYEDGKGKPTRPGSPHRGQRPPTVRIVPDDPPAAPASPWAPGSSGTKSGWLVGVSAYLGELFSGWWDSFVAPFRARPKRATSSDGRKWKERPHNPGGGTGQTPPQVHLIDGTTPEPPNVVPIRPTGEPPVSEGTGTKAKPAKRPPKGGGGPAGGGGAVGGDSIAEGAQQWARKLPETLVDARQDAQTISEGLAGIADALLMRMGMETDRSISAQCVEPYQEAAQLLRQAADKGQEVHQRLLQRYGPVAEELAKPDTPEPEYLKEGT